MKKSSLETHNMVLARQAIDTLNRVQDRKAQSHIRRPLTFEIRRFVTYLSKNNFNVSNIAEEQYIVNYRGRELAFIDLTSNYLRKFYVVWYNPQDFRKSVPNSRGKLIMNRGTMIYMEYNTIPDIVKDLEKYVLTQYVGTRIHHKY